MARARNIKPGFFLNEDLVELPYEDRLLFIGLWTLADREGRLENRPKRIKMQIFPADALDVPEALLRLYGKKLITLYNVDGMDFIAVNNFLKHQHPHHKEAQSSIPNPEGKVQALGKPECSPSESLLPITESLLPIKETSSRNVNDPVPYKKIIDLYHKALPDLPAVAKLTPKRKGQIRQRYREDLPKLDQWENFFDYVAQSDFLMGRVQPTNDRKPFRADIEWLTNSTNFTKIAEEKYHVR